MKKKSYKKLKNRLYRAIEKSEREEQRAEQAEAKAKYYEKRFLTLGSNIEIKDTGHYIEELTWQIEPEEWGNYAVITGGEIDEKTKEKVAQILAEGLIENNLVRFITREPWEGHSSDPMEDALGICAVKLCVVPWEQMPHKRTIELKQYVERTLVADAR